VGGSRADCGDGGGQNPVPDEVVPPILAGERHDQLLRAGQCEKRERSLPTDLGKGTAPQVNIVERFKGTIWRTSSIVAIAPP
jgi:hypothetical protein